MPFMIKSKYENGTYTPNSLATAQYEAARSSVLGGHPGRPRGSKGILASCLLGKYRWNDVRINLPTLDREFDTQEATHLLNDQASDS